MALTVADSLQVEHVDWGQLDTILLDMDGTLLDLAFDNHFWGTIIPEQWGRNNGLDLPASQHRLAPLFAAEQGSLNWYCLDFWGQTLELDIPVIKTTCASGIRWRPQAETFLSRLWNSHLDVVLITNAHPVTLEIKAEKLPLAKWFNKMVSSHSYGAPKETTPFWEALISDRPFNPQRTLFIDDSEHVLDAAQSYGIGHLITLRQPDSSLPPKTNTRHPSIHHFEEIMQGLPTIG
jgi:FMN phosphatase YigB (HAD superfamily)